MPKKRAREGEGAGDGKPVPSSSATRPAEKLRRIAEDVGISARQASRAAGHLLTCAVGCRRPAGPAAPPPKNAPPQVRSAARLLDDGNTLPFIARYRKEQTEGLDEAALRALAARLAALDSLEQLRASTLAKLEKLVSARGALPLCQRCYLGRAPVGRGAAGSRDSR